MSDIVIGYVIAAIVGLIVFADWLIDFFEANDMRLRPYLEKEVMKNEDHQDDV